MKMSLIPQVLKSKVNAKATANALKDVLKPKNVQEAIGNLKLQKPLSSDAFKKEVENLMQKPVSSDAFKKTIKNLKK